MAAPWSAATIEIIEVPKLLQQQNSGMRYFYLYLFLHICVCVCVCMYAYAHIAYDVYIYMLFICLYTCAHQA